MVNYVKSILGIVNFGSDESFSYLEEIRRISLQTTLMAFFREIFSIFNEWELVHFMTDSDI